MLWKLMNLKNVLPSLLIFVLIAIFLSSCSTTKERIVYKTINVPVAVETVKYIEQDHHCFLIEYNNIITWGELLITYKTQNKAFERCLLSLD